MMEEEEEMMMVQEEQWQPWPWQIRRRPHCLFKTIIIIPYECRHLPISHRTIQQSNNPEPIWINAFN